MLSMTGQSAAELQTLADKLAAGPRRVLLFGESGAGKSTLAAQLAQNLAASGRMAMCLGADPGSPSFGVPGAISSGYWRHNCWQMTDYEALCSLDAARFRLPLLSLVRRLAAKIGDEILLIDPPGIVRGVAGAEIFTGLVEAAAVDLVLMLVRDRNKSPLTNELATLGCEVVFLPASPAAHLPGKKRRSRRRTNLWRHYLNEAAVKTMHICENLLTGTPPPLHAAESWPGRQIALLKAGKTLAMGEIVTVDHDIFQVRIADTSLPPDQFLVRDACINEQGLLTTQKNRISKPRSLPPDIAPVSTAADESGEPVVNVRGAMTLLLNGVFGDPLVHLRLQNKKRSFLFDLGDGQRLSARLAHQISDVFISHAHIDHIGGFLWLLRSRIGFTAPCRLYGPPGLASHIANQINGICWDRIGAEGPKFEVGELHGDTLLVYRLQAGIEQKSNPEERRAPAGLLLNDRDCKVKAVTLSHGGLPVLAYGLDLPPKLNVRKERLSASKLTPGPWLGRLKERFADDDRQAVIQLPDGSMDSAQNLAGQFLHISAARRLVYATDLSDNSANREKLTALAREAHVLWCEAAFVGADRHYAESSGHLTALACGEIALAARVRRLLPFNFSRRYEKDPSAVYDEIRAVCKKLVTVI